MISDKISVCIKRESLQKALCRLLQLHSSKNEREYMMALEEFVEAKVKETR